MEKKIHLKIITPSGIYFTGDVDFLRVHAEHGVLGILPNHQPLISTVTISEMKIVMNGQKFYYAVGGGILDVKKDLTILLLNSVERVDEIDIGRAILAKERAEARLKEAQHDDQIDVVRAQASLLKALNRIKIGNYKIDNK